MYRFEERLTAPTHCKSMGWKEKIFFSIVKNKLKKGNPKPDETVKKKWSKLAVFSILFPVVVTVLVYAIIIGFLPAFILLLTNIVIALLAFADIIDNNKKGSFLAILAILISILLIRFFYLQQLD